jgi:hypothetical protein
VNSYELAIDELGAVSIENEKLRAENRRLREVLREARYQYERMCNWKCICGRAYVCEHCSAIRELGEALANSADKEGK